MNLCVYWPVPGILWHRAALKIRWRVKGFEIYGWLPVLVPYTVPFFICLSPLAPDTATLFALRGSGSSFFFLVIHTI